MWRLAPALGVAMALVLGSSSAGATWSIAAVDPETQEVGVVLASCVTAPAGSTILPDAGALAPGIGALAAQALYSPQTRNQALELLLDGASPQEVIDTVVASDGASAVRQYGVATLDLQSAGFTGAGTQSWSGDLQGQGVSAQGNILYRAEVVGDALAAFEARAPRCPFTLADRLMLAIEAGAAQGGDNRCSEEQTALAAVLKVARPGDEVGSPYLDLRIPSQPEGGDNPVVLLRAEYDQWRRANPPDDSRCVEATGTGTESGTPDGTTEAPTSGSPADGTTTAPPPPPVTSTSETTRGSSSGMPASGGDGNNGCGCRSAPSGWGWLALVSIAWMRRRRTT